MQKITYWIDRSLLITLEILMAAIVLDVIWQVVSRFIVRIPSNWSEELAGFLLIWIGLLGASYVMKIKGHLGIDILTYKLKDMKKRVVEVIIYSTVSLFAIFVLVIGGLRLVRLTFILNQVSPTLGIKMGYVYLVLPITGLFMIYYAVNFVIDAIKGRIAEPVIRSID